MTQRSRALGDSWLARLAAIALVASSALVGPACALDDSDLGSSQDAYRRCRSGRCQDAATSTDSATPTARSVVVTSPKTGTTISGTTVLSAAMTGTNQNVEFFDGTGTFIGRATLSGQTGTYAWDTRTHADGDVQVFAKAWDVPAGVTPSNEVLSASITLSIKNAQTTTDAGIADTGASDPTSPCGSIPAGAIDIRTYGAATSATDNHGAIQSAINAAKVAGKAVYVPPGTFSHTGTLVLDGVNLWGGGATSVLHGTDPANQAVVLRGSGAGVHSVGLTSNATVRDTTPWSAAIWIDHASNFEVACITVQGAGSAGFIALGSSLGKIHHNTLKNTLADSIHMTDGTNQVDVYRNHIEYSGDDGIACVSYGGVSPGNGPDTAYVRDIRAWENVILYNEWGRAMSVVGGRRIEYRNNYLHGGTVQSACLYFAQEGSYATWEANGVYAHDNQVIGCGGSMHPASLLVYADQWPNRDIRIENNHFWQNRGGQGSIGIQGTNINVTQSGNTTDVGAVPAIPPW
jgi:hypothetical protein